MIRYCRYSKALTGAQEFCNFAKKTPRKREENFAQIKASKTVITMLRMGHLSIFIKDHGRNVWLGLFILFAADNR